MISIRGWLSSSSSLERASCPEELLEFLKSLLLSSMSFLSCFWRYLFWASSSAFSLRAFSATCSGVRLDDMIEIGFFVGYMFGLKGCVQAWEAKATRE